MATERQLRYRALQGLRGASLPPDEVWRWQGFTAPGVGRITNARGVEIIAPVRGNASTAIGSEVLYLPGEPDGVIVLQSVVVPTVPVVPALEGVPVITLYYLPNDSNGIDFYVWFQGKTKLIHSQPNATQPTGTIELNSATSWTAAIGWRRTTGITIPRWFDAGFVTSAASFTPAVYPATDTQNYYLSKGKVAIHHNANSDTYPYEVTLGPAVDVGQCQLRGPSGIVTDPSLATVFNSAVDLNGNGQAIDFYLRGAGATGVLLLQGPSGFAYFFASSISSSLFPNAILPVSYIGGSATSFNDGDVITARMLQRSIIVNLALPQNGIDENALTISNLGGEIVTINPASNLEELKGGAGAEVFLRTRFNARKIDDSATVHGVSTGSAQITYQQSNGTETTLTRTAPSSSGLFAALDNSKFYGVNAGLDGGLGFINIYAYDLMAATYTQTGFVEYRAPAIDGAAVLDHAVWPAKLTGIMPY